MLPVTLCAGVGKVAAVAAADERFEDMGSDEVAGENCEGLWGVCGWNAMMAGR